VLLKRPASGYGARMSLLTTARTAGSSAGGALLATATRSLSALRPAAKPLHPRGDVVAGRLYRSGSDASSGVAWLDEVGQDDVLARRSRAVGLPGSLPDVHGLAVRVPVPGGHGDLLFSTTGWGRLSRFVLTPSRTPQGRPMTTLLPYRTPQGPVLLGARSTGEETFELAWARYDGDWHAFADLRLSQLPGTDEDVSFDAVLHQLPGLEQYDAVERLREPSYRTARESRDQ
jgi:hypothetical protein